MDLLYSTLHSQGTGGIMPQVLERTEAVPQVPQADNLQQPSPGTPLAEPANIDEALAASDSEE
jgi:hypothetical protein